MLDFYGTFKGPHRVCCRVRFLPRAPPPARTGRANALRPRPPAQCGWASRSGRGRAVPGGGWALPDGEPLPREDLARLGGERGEERGEGRADTAMPCAMLKRISKSRYPSRGTLTAPTPPPRHAPALQPSAPRARRRRPKRALRRRRRRRAPRCRGCRRGTPPCRTRARRLGAVRGRTSICVRNPWDSSCAKKTPLRFAQRRVACTGTRTEMRMQN
jgi:hypothetical protein